MLTSTAMRTSDVAYAVGYNDPHYFSYLFKKHNGLSLGISAGKKRRKTYDAYGQE